MTATEPISHPQPIDPEMAPILDALPDMGVDAESLPTIRALMQALGAAADVDATEHIVDADLGIIVRVIGDTTKGGKPGLFYVHGGGYVVGDRRMDDTRLRTWSDATGCVCVSVEYRLAPEHPYPAGVEDCYVGLRWTRDHADELGIDADRIGIAGLSAGGGLTAALALLARDRGEVPLCCQLLDSPMLDPRQVTASSRQDGLHVWSRESNRFGWDSYLGDLAGATDLPPYAAAGLADDLRGLPPALVMVGSVDGFRDEDIEYATRLNQAGVPTELHVYPGAPHGFSLFPGAVATQADTDATRWLSRQFAPRC